MEKKTRSPFGMLIGAALLTATSAVGPGFLTQTAYFTEKLQADLSLIILLTTLVTIGAQLNIWRVIVASGKRGQNIANEAVPGFGWLIAILIFFGGAAFNIGNLAGTGMGLNVIFGTDPRIGAALSAAICILLFAFREVGKAMDKFVTCLALAMLILVICVVFASKPPMGEILIRTFSPTSFDSLALLTLIGGTGGGYILFAGAHRLVDGGFKGARAVKQATNSSIFSAGVTALIRYLLFFATFGVVSMGIMLNPQNPAATPFEVVAGPLGHKFFGLILWCASITSVVGCSFTSVSFLRTFSKTIDENPSRIIMALIAACTLIFVGVGRPVELLILAGAINGLVLPFGLLAILLASRNSKIVGKEYHHPLWLLLFGVVALVITIFVALQFLGGITGVFTI
ncbi:MAG TPA: divalent metal cation transporter [Thermoplasmata archaeon]|nr:divalent metal cation transporter [Thermoplasmata archaeon]